MAITIEEAKAFIKDADKSRENWLTAAERSWSELKRRSANNRIWSVTPNSAKKRQRYPLWWSIFKIRQPLYLSRVGIPIGKDVTQDGNDPVGATAAILKERLATNLARNFGFFDVMASCRDDFLATNVAVCRAYYEREEVKETVRQRLTPEKTKGSEDVTFVDDSGKVVESDAIGQDDEGYFVEMPQLIDVINESVCLEPVLYKDFYVDPDIRRWGRKCKRIAFSDYYSKPEFIDIFGTLAFSQLPEANEIASGVDEGSPKRHSIKVFEYWDAYEKETYWFAENGSDFIRPQKDELPDNEESLEGETTNGLYNLENFFPIPPPLVINQSTDEFWPIPEHYQLSDILQDVHTIFSRMVAMTRAIRVRLLFDNNVEGLEPALNEAAEGDALGVPNLAQSLVSAGGSLENVVQYVPVKALIEGLAQLYTALDQRLNIIYKLSGTSDLLQGQTDPTARTYGEQQLKEKYALNQSAEGCRKMQEFVRDSYELLCEVALKNFKDESLEVYLMPSTLDPIQKQNYKAALGMIKEDHKRFRIELETDSTMALNENYDKQMRIELVNALTTGLEKTAATASSNPALAIPELHALKYLIQGFRQGKMFQDEIVQSIDNVIQLAQQAKPPFDASLYAVQAEAKFKEARAQNLAQTAQTDIYIAQTDAAREDFKARMDAQAQQFQQQIDSLRLRLDEQATGAKVQNQMADNQRLEEQLAFHEQQPQMPPQPSVVVLPQPAPMPTAQVQPIVIPINGGMPQAGPTIINAPAQPPQTSVIQPVQQVPVPTGLGNL